MELPANAIIPAIVTPFSENGSSLETESLAELCDFLISKGVDGLLVMGTTGEWPLLTVPERQQVVRTVVEHVAGRVPVIAQTGALSTASSVSLSSYSRDVGAAAVCLVTPHYYRFSQSELSTHLLASAAAVQNCDVYLYDIPTATGNRLDTATVSAIRNTSPNVKGIKDSSGELPQIQALAELGDDFRVIAGSDQISMAALVSGATGVVSSICGVFPEPYIDLKYALAAGDVSAAKRAQRKINRLVRVATSEQTIPLLKAGLERRGLPHMGRRRPFREPSEQAVTALEACLAEIDGTEKSL